MPAALPSLSNAGGRVAALLMPPYLLRLILLHPVLHGLALIRCHVEPLCAGNRRAAVRPLPSVIAEDGTAIALGKGRTSGESRDCGRKNDRFHGYSPWRWASHLRSYRVSAAYHVSVIRRLWRALGREFATAG